MGVGYLFGTKRSNLICLNVFSSLWLAGVIVSGISAAIYAFQYKHFGDLWISPVLAALGVIVYGVQRWMIISAFRERPKVTEADIEDARRMLYGDKDKPGE